jgi:hypothetical protein
MKLVLVEMLGPVHKARQYFEVDHSLKVTDNNDIIFN